MNYSKYIDHTLLKADATTEDIIQLCNEAVVYKFKSVCVNPYYVPLAKACLKDTGILVCCVIGFPLGAASVITKNSETIRALVDGADEIDMVINIGALKNHNYDYVEHEISFIKSRCKEKVLKVIIETCLLTNEEKIKACECAAKAGADYVKTSTGFSKAGATVEDVKLIKNSAVAIVNNQKHCCLVKASGGIKTKKDFEEMIKAGADRIGTSNGVKIIDEINEN